LLVSAPVDCEPLRALAPDQAPDAAQEVALLADQVNVALPPLEMALGPTLRLTVGAAALTETIADCTAEPPVPVQVKVYVALAVSAPVECDPLMGCVPDQAPDAEQAVALVADQVNVELLPLVMLLGLAPSVIVGAFALTETVADWLALPPDPVQLKV
jgi:hypothetical protein